MSYKFDFAFLADKWPDFVAGAWLTIQLTILSIAFGFVLGTVCAMARVYGGPLLRRLVGAYVETIRNTPLLIQIFIVYFGLSSLGLKLSAEVSAVIALTVNMGAYSTEIMRAGIQSIQRTQLEAADCLGLTRCRPSGMSLLPAWSGLSIAGEPGCAPDAGLLDHLADLDRGTHRHRQPCAVRHLPQLRGLHDRGGGLSLAVRPLSPGILGGRAAFVRPQAPAGDAAVIQLNANHLLYLLEAARWTVLLSLIAFLGGAVVGLPLALMRLSRVGLLRGIASGYIQLIQGTPLLIVLFLSYFGLGILGYKLIAVPLR
jgi:His/Glu/Gln/Arg/opine family amino acid ABC transporter permease subunit